MMTESPLPLPQPAWLEQAISDFYQQGWALIPDAIPESLCLALQTELHQLSLTPAGVGRAQDHQLIAEIRRDQTHWLDGASAAQQRFLHYMAAVQQQINRNCFLGLTWYEAHFARYQTGDFYQKHLDAFKGRSNRILSSVCYLNSPASGGELIIYNEQEQPIQKIKPLTGSLVLFESERFPHEVLPAASERLSIAGWFRND